MRYFIAIDMPEGVKRSYGHVLAGLRECGAREGYRFVTPQNLHLTLRFLGDVEETALNPIRAALATYARQYGPLALDVRGVGGFPSVQFPKIAWIGIHELTGQLAALQANIEAAAVSEGMKPETQAFAAHVTFARVRDRRFSEILPELIDQWRDRFDFGSITASEVTLYASALGSGPPVYSVVERYPLGAPVATFPLERSAGL